MKRMNIYTVFTLICLSLTCHQYVQARENKRAKESREAGSHARQILIVGLDDNVKSNYFYNGMIAEETGMQADGIDQEYNRIIAENIATACKDKQCHFIAADPAQFNEQFLHAIRTDGEEEECYSDPSSIPEEEWKQTLEKADADYMLVLNQHYLKWQETPLRTLFHIVSYTLFDKEKREICRGNNYFTSMNLEKPDKLRKISRKSSSKIASTVIKSLDEQ